MSKKLTLIIDDNLHSRLRALAAREHRSLHGQITYLLERHVPHTLSTTVIPEYESMRSTKSEDIGNGQPSQHASAVEDIDDVQPQSVNR